MGIFDFKLADIKAIIKKLNIGFNKEQKTIAIQASDNSLHVHYHSELGLSNEEILSLPSEKVGDFVKQRALLNLQTAYKNDPEGLNRILGKYNPTAVAMSAVSTTAGSIALNPMPSVDFINILPTTIEKAVKVLNDSLTSDVVWNFEMDKKDGKTA